MSKIKKEFEKWHDEYFGNAQSDDSPYSYYDVMAGFVNGWNRSKSNMSNKNTKNKYSQPLPIKNDL